MFLVLSFIATDEIYAQEGGTVTINYKMYLNDGETVTPMTEYGGTTISISKLDDNGNVDNNFRYENTTKGIYIYGGSGSVPVRNQNCNGQEDEKLVLDFLSKGKYRIDRKDRTAPKSFRKIGSSDDMSAAEKRNQIEFEIGGEQDQDIYIFDAFDKDALVTYTKPDGSTSSALMREIATFPRGDMAKYIKSVVDAKLPVEKKWEGEEFGNNLKVRLRWKLDVKVEVEELHKAITVKGVDEATIIQVLSRYMQVKPEYRKILTDELLAEYLAQKGKPLDEELKKALLGHFEDYILLTLYNAQIYQIPTNVMVDDEGYCYVDLTLDKDEDWKKVLESVVVPTDAEVVELTEIPGNKTKWEVVAEGKTKTVRAWVWHSDPEGQFNEEMNDTGSWIQEEQVIPDPIDNAKNIIITNICPPVDHKVEKKVNETQHVVLKTRKDTFTYTIRTNVPREAEYFTITDDMVDALEFADKENIVIMIDGKDLPADERAEALTVEGNSLKIGFTREMVHKYATLPIEIAFKARIAEDADLSAYQDGRIPNVAVAEFDKKFYYSDEDEGAIVQVLDESEEPVKNTKKDKKETPGTGDDMSLAGILAALMMAAAASLVTVRRARR